MNEGDAYVVEEGVTSMTEVKSNDEAVNEIDIGVSSVGTGTKPVDESTAVLVLDDGQTPKNLRLL